MLALHMGLVLLPGIDGRLAGDTLFGVVGAATSQVPLEVGAVVEGQATVGASLKERH